MYKKIGAYGIIGNLHTVALIGLDGSIDWLCMPRIDSPSVFGALLDDQRGGSFSVSPASERDAAAAYLPGTNILVTKFRTGAGVMQVIDFMPVDLSSGEERHELYRCIDAVKGSIAVNMIFEPRLDYARTRTALEKAPNGVTARGKGEAVALSCTRDLAVANDNAYAEWRLAEGDRVWMRLEFGADRPADIDVAKAEASLKDTEAYWRNWLAKSETGRTIDLGPYKDGVERSALILKLLSYHPADTIAAAATTSLPEEVGGVRNWDYRYTWVRDTSFTLQALFNLGHLSEMEGYFNWIRRVLEHGADRLQIMYGLRGEEDLSEAELDHFDGYKGSRPVRIGNAAAGQKQLDIYGEIMDAALKLSDYAGKIDYELWPFLCGLCDHAAAHWKDKDSGIWEVRGGPRHFVYSKAMCWLALDRGITIAHRYGFPADLRKWEQTRTEIKNEILDKGWNDAKNSFVQHYDGDALDASSLLLPVLGFLPFDDPRVISTIEAVQRELGHDGLLYRYRTADHLPGREGVFLLCTFWLIDCLVGLNRLDDAERLLQRMEKTANHLGIFPEQYDPEWNEALGNIPQAFTHIGYINSVVRLLQAKNALKQLERKMTAGRISLWSTVILNDGEPRKYLPPREIVPRLKQDMNILRGAYFDTPGSRVAYERMSVSPAYREYIELSYSLKKMDPAVLRSREERIAFWINLYNVIVIHGVIELGIRDSVKEAANFFKRIRYRVGDMSFSPEEIEHGVLRGNARPPHFLRRVFREDDRRLRFAVRPMDPRIHFALVCASSSCPPIDVYTADKLYTELDIAGRTFLNAGGIRIDKARKRASLSRIFKWYARDFGPDLAGRLRFIAPYLYDAETRAFIEDHADRIRVDYQKYDWRLNRI